MKLRTSNNFQIESVELTSVLCIHLVMCVEGGGAVLEHNVGGNSMMKFYFRGRSMTGHQGKKVKFDHPRLQHGVIIST
jgi:hypothetical protein